jgi:biotin carboxyl carrier protein
MKLQAEIDGRGYEVDITDGPEGIAVTLEGKAMSVDARALDGFFSSLLIGGKAYETTVEPDGDGAWRVQVGIEAHRVVFIDPLRSEKGARGEGAERGAGGPIASLMPGKVVRVMVKAGDEVAEGQDLLVVEAMKMENAVQAPSAGRIGEVLVAPGETVEAGAPLVVMA